MRSDLRALVGKKGIHPGKLDANKKCRLDGKYLAQFSFVCPRGARGCNSGGKNLPFKLSSENFCKSKTITIPKDK